jgi:hypothetical protein
LAALASLTPSTRADDDPHKTIQVESEVPAYTLPDPLLGDNGLRIRTPQSWVDLRRPALLKHFSEEIYGRTLVGRPTNLAFIVREEKKDAYGGRATRLRVGILFEGSETGRQMELLVYLPNHIHAPVPIFLGLNFDGNYTTTVEPDLPVPKHWINGLFYHRIENHRATESGRGVHQHMWPIGYALENGYGIATAAYGEIEPDEPGRWKEGPRGLGPEPGTQDWGTLGAWAWGLSRAMDYLEMNPRVDPQRVAVMGFSRLGKAALWSAAQDPRFAMFVSQGSGAGGVALSKRLFGENVEHLTSRLGHWFAPRFATYARNEAALTIDQHELIATLAPRPVLVLSASTDLWSDPKGEFLGLAGADPVYRLFRTDGLTPREWPAASRLTDSTLGYYLRPGAHDVTFEDWQAMIHFAELHLAKKTKDGK